MTGVIGLTLRLCDMNNRGIHSRLKRQFERPFEKAVEIFLLYAFSI
jgi:hypothetical protein